MSGFLSRRGLLLSSAGAGLAAALPARAYTSPDNPLDDVDGLADQFLTHFGTPGVALGVVRPGMPDWIRTYGRRALMGPEPVDGDTLFAVASNTKAMTAAGLAMLVDEGKLAWDDPVTKHLPDFAMHEAITTQLMTVRDLLTHRSGLPLGAGDLMIWPTTLHTRQDVFRGLRHLKPVRGFRVGYDYDNVLYVVAGILIEKLSGKSWEDFTRERVLGPAGMATAVPAPSLVTTNNICGRHTKLGGPVYGMGTMQQMPRQETDSFAPAGGVQASVKDMLAWLKVQLARGKGPGGRALWQEARTDEMWAPQTIMRTSAGPTVDEPGRAIFNTYALGWNVFDYRGERVIGHSGAMNGQITYTAMIPARGVAITVLTNAEEGGVLNGLRNTLLDRMMGARFDWLAYWKALDKKNKDQALADLAAAETGKPQGGPSQPLAAYAGLYGDPWYGHMRVSLEDGGLNIYFVKTPAFAGRLEPWGPDTFRTRFADRTVEDAIVQFHMKGGKVERVTMRALSPLADFSYDFHHLEFTPVR